MLSVPIVFYVVIMQFLLLLLRAFAPLAKARASRSPRSLQPQTAPCGSIPPIELVEPSRQRRADQQVVVPSTGRHAPAQQLPRSGENFVGTCRQLVAVDAGDVGPVVGVLLDPAAVDQSDEGPAQIRLGLPIKEE